MIKGKFPKCLTHVMMRLIHKTYKKNLTSISLLVKHVTWVVSEEIADYTKQKYQPSMSWVNILHKLTMLKLEINKVERHVPCVTLCTTYLSYTDIHKYEHVLSKEQN